MKFVHLSIWFVNMWALFLIFPLNRFVARNSSYFCGNCNKWKWIDWQTMRRWIEIESHAKIHLLLQDKKSIAHEKYQWKWETEFNITIKLNKSHFINGIDFNICVFRLSSFFRHSSLCVHIEMLKVCWRTACDAMFKLLIENLSECGQKMKILKMPKPRMQMLKSSRNSNNSNKFCALKYLFNWINTTII